MELCRIVRTMDESMNFVEYSFDGDIDEVVLFGPGRAVLDWESKEGGFGGYIHFVVERNDEDRDWIRTVCRSLARSKDATASPCYSVHDNF